MSQLTDKVESAILENIISLGLELEYSELVKEGENNIYKIVIDKKDGLVNICDCENLSRSVEDIVDKYVNVSGGYVLEVSSAGLERELKNIRLFRKYINYKVKIKLYKKTEDEKEIIGKLVEVFDDYVIIEKENNNIKVEMKNIAHANTVYDFSNI